MAKLDLIGEDFVNEPPSININGRSKHGELYDGEHNVVGSTTREHYKDVAGEE